MSRLFKSSLFSAGVLACAVMLALAFSGYLLNEQTVGDNSVFLVIIIIQVIVFIVPALVYCRLRGTGMRSPMLLAGVKPSHMLFVLFAALLLVSGNLLLKYLLGVDYSSGNDSVLSLSLASGEVDSGAGLFFAYCLAPAVCEELVFRGVILSEYRRYGSFNAVLLTSFYFALLHFDSNGFLLYLYAGIVLGLVTVVCRSVFPAMILHLINNLLNVFGNDLFLRITMQQSGVFFMGFVLFSLFLLSLIFVLSRIEQTYYGYAKEPPTSELLPKSFANLYVYISPAVFLPLAVFLLIRLLH